MEYTTLRMMFFQRILKFLEHILFSTRKSEEVLHSLTIDSLVPLLKSQTVELSSENIITLLPYQNPLVKACVHEAKFFEHRKARLLLSEVLGDYLEQSLEELTALDHEQIILIPIPLSKKRKAERGYNQVEEIVKEALRGIDSARMDTTLLERSRDTLAQAKLSRAKRLINITDAFVATRSPDSHTLYIIVDDVATTGATLKEAKRALSRALPNSSRILLLALSH